MSVTQRIKARALELGFDAVGVAAIAPGPDPPGPGGAAGSPRGAPGAEPFEAWLAAGRHGDMTWLATERSRARRLDPTLILPGARSMVCVALCHDAGRDVARDARIGRIARYAGGEDYHRVMRDRLGVLEREIEGLLPGARALWYSDTGAILERGWAERAGLGWTAKHSGLISSELGSYLLLGEVIVDRDLDPDPADERDRCGACTRCIEACPTRAIVAPGQVDARRCVSYLTIELRGAIPPGMRPLVGDWILGCDVCQEVCPWNRLAGEGREARLRARTLDGWSLERFLALDEAGFGALFAGSPVRRARRGGFLRNVCVALGNRGDAAAAPALARARDSDPDPLVREHAEWALERIEAGGS